MSTIRVNAKSPVREWLTAVVAGQAAGSESSLEGYVERWKKEKGAFNPDEEMFRMRVREWLQELVVVGYLVKEGRYFRRTGKVMGVAAATGLAAGSGKGGVYRHAQHPGWQGNGYVDGKLKTRYFSDAKHGGREAAEKAAWAWVRNPAGVVVEEGKKERDYEPNRDGGLPPEGALVEPAPAGNGTEETAAPDRSKPGWLQKEMEEDYERWAEEQQAAKIRDAESRERAEVLGIHGVTAGEAEPSGRSADGPSAVPVAGALSEAGLKETRWERFLPEVARSIEMLTYELRGLRARRGVLQEELKRMDEAEVPLQIAIERLRKLEAAESLDSVTVRTAG